MERVKIGFVFNLVILLVAIGGGNCLKCYVCHSGTNPSCADPYKTDQTQLQECSAEVARSGNGEVANILRRFGVSAGLETLILPQQVPFNVPMACQKITLNNGNSEKVVLRTCVSDTVEDKTSCKAYEHVAGKSKIASCDVCKADACNGVGFMKAPAILGLISVVTSVLLLNRV